MRQIISRIAPASVLFSLLLLVTCPVLAGADMMYEAADGETVHVTLSHANKPADAIALLFHQAGANRHEYDRIAPRLNRLGFDTLAIDQRSGGSMFDHANETVREHGSSTSYRDAYADLKGALAWAKSHDYHTIVAVGSSYSASLALRLAAAQNGALTAIAVFSPGEYFDDPDLIKAAVARIRVPLYITTDPKEENHVDEVLERADASVVTRYKPSHGVHGASTLDPDRDPTGYKANWRSFSAFMARFAPGGSSA